MLTKYQIIFLFFIVCNFTSSAQTLRKRTTLLMGGRFDISIVAKDSLSAEQNIDAVIEEIRKSDKIDIEALASRYLTEELC